MSAIKSVVDEAIDKNIRYIVLENTKDIGGTELSKGTQLIFVMDFGLATCFMLTDEDETFVTLPNDSKAIAPVKLSLSFARTGQIA